MQDTYLDSQFIQILDKLGNPVILTLRQALERKTQEARKQDKALGIQRKQIPVLFVELPDVPESVDFQRIANAICKIAICGYILPETPEQGIWLRCLQLYWEAKAIVLANRIYKLIPDPVQPGEPVQKMLPAKALENLKLEVEADLAWYNLLRFSEPEIKIWTGIKKINYPFINFEQLFIETLHIDFEVVLIDGAFAPFPFNPSRRQERDHYRDWLQFLNGSFSERPSKQKRFVEILYSMGWKGYSLLALQEALYNDQFDLRDGKRYESLKKLWRVYLKKQRLLLKFLDSRLYWEDALPYQSKQTDTGRRTKSREPIKAVLTEEGYLDWTYLNNN